MDFLTLLAIVVLVGSVALAAYVGTAIALFTHAVKVASRQEQIPPSLDCRDSNHRACLGCSCHCHT